MHLHENYSQKKSHITYILCIILLAAKLHTRAVMNTSNSNTTTGNAKVSLMRRTNSVAFTLPHKRTQADTKDHLQASKNRALFTSCIPSHWCIAALISDTLNVTSSAISRMNQICFCRTANDTVLLEAVSVRLHYVGKTH